MAEDNVNPVMAGLGGMIGGLTDIGVQWQYEQNPELQGQFPFQELPDPLPTVDDAIITLEGLGIWGLGKSTGNSTLRDVGLGNTAYGLGLAARNTTLRILRQYQE